MLVSDMPMLMGDADRLELDFSTELINTDIGQRYVSGQRKPHTSGRPRRFASIYKVACSIMSKVGKYLARRAFEA